MEIVKKVAVKKHNLWTVFSVMKRSCGRSVANKSLSCKTDTEKKPGTEAKPKITVVQKHIMVKEGTFTILQTKPASGVIKKLNWENKYLYGSIISDKPFQNRNKHINKADEIIQYVPDIVVKDNISSECTLGNNLSTQSLDAESCMLKFPLINRLKSLESENAVLEANFIREHLTSLCGSSRLPSVSSILEKTMPPERVNILERWKQNMIKELGEDGFAKYKAELFSTGSSLHNSINNLLSDPEAEVQVETANIGHWKSLKSIFPVVSDVKLLEEHITHPFLMYKGVIDCFAKYRDHLVVIDWKTSKKRKLSLASTYDNPLQIAAYVGALNFDPKFQYMVKKGLLVVAYEDGSPANAHLINENFLLRYWTQWLQRLKLYWELVKTPDSQLQ